MHKGLCTTCGQPGGMPVAYVADFPTPLANTLFGWVQNSSLHTESTQAIRNFAHIIILFFHLLFCLFPHNTQTLLYKKLSI